MANNKKRKYNGSGNRYYKNTKKKNKNKDSIENSNEEKNIVVEDAKEIKAVDEAIDELFEKDSVLEVQSSAQDDLGETDLIPPENNPVEVAIEEEDNIVDVPFITLPNEVDNNKFDEVAEETVTDNSLEKNEMDATIPLELGKIENYGSDYQSFETKNSEELVSENKVASNKGGMYLSYGTRVLINVVGVILFIILAGVLLISSISIKARSNVLYKQTSNLDYKVYLKENEYYKEQYLTKNMQYIASLIDNVDVNFNYNFNVNQNIDYKYTYYIKADVNVTDTQDKSKIIYSKTDKLTEPSTVIKDNSTGFNINENVKINYAKYNDLVKAFKSSYAISADSNLVLSLCVEIEDEKGNKIRSLESNDAIKLNIPLTEQMIDITMDYKDINNSNNVSVYKDFSISNKVTFSLSVLSLLISLVFLVRLFIFIKKTTAKKTIYDITLSKILREYDRVIVNSKKIVDLNDDIIDVNSFNELLDVRDNLEKPIIFSEIHKGQKSVFIVKTANETYRYILKLVDLEEGTTK